MPLKSRFDLLGGNAAAVIRHPDKTGAATPGLHCDLAGAGVQGVLHKFLDHRGGSLHHLSGGDAGNPRLSAGAVFYWLPGKRRER